MKYYIIAGEASGDLHGANLIKAILKKDPKAQIRCWGGDDMASEGGKLVKHYKELAFMGFIEVLFNLKTILNNIKFCKKDIVDFQPDAIIFIDYPGFNMRIAKWAKALNYPVHYYISPQIWAWKENRIHKIKRDVDHMYVILPFEKQFYEDKHDYKVHFVGHPLIDAISNRAEVNESEFRKTFQLSEKPIIALLPGSRKQEITTMLETMLEVSKRFTAYQFVIAGAPSQSSEFYKQLIGNHDVTLINNRTYDLLEVAHAALVTSGTATLETGLFKVPQVVCYKANAISYAIAKRVIKIKYISLVNLIMDRLVVTELIQDDFNITQLEQELTKILEPSQREHIAQEYSLLEEQLGSTGASQRTAELIVDSL